MMFEKHSLTKVSGKLRAASATLAGKSKDAYIISGARKSSEDSVISVISSFW